VLVVDDSAASRDELVRILDGADGLVVAGTAADGEQGLAEALRLAPDVVVLDLQMPRMDGFSLLRLLMARRPTPVVVLSSQSRRADVFKALELGALDFVARPERGGLASVREELLEKCATVRALRIQNLAAGARAIDARELEPARVAVVGASTGGTEALRVLLEAMPADAPAIAVVQHMPEVFTAQFARRLDKLCRIEVKEAADGDRLLPGRALVAPGNRHLSVKRAGGLVAVVSDGPPVSLHRPSVDVLFHSAARIAGPGTMGVLLTGMGDDGADGLLDLRRAGAHTVAQDESTSVVFGMPKEAIARGAAIEVLPLPRIAPAVLAWAR
jgi:two-component system chemotaxis response regulator CheB